MKRLATNLLIALLLFLVISGLFALLADPDEGKQEISITALVREINKQNIKEIIVSNSELSILFQDNREAISRKEEGISLSKTLINHGVEKEKLKNVEIDFREAKNIWIWLGPVLFLSLPILFLVFFFLFISKQVKTGTMKAFDFTKAKSRLFGAEGHPKEKISFKDVAGLKEAKQELMEVVEFLKNPKKFLNIGARIPRGVLLLGQSGVGKTLLARAVAGESNVPFLSVSGSEFVEMFVGVGSGRVRSLFQEARRYDKCIIFIDELDAIGRHRGIGIGSGHDEREQTLNQILVEMDGFERDSKTIIIAATNRGDILDSALLRPGRFDRKVILDLPDINDREKILEVHCREKSLSSNINLKEIAERTPGFSGADLANLTNEAAILAARRDKAHISQTELLESIEKVLLGPERKSHILSKKEKEIAAFHEAGHALISAFLPEAETIRKVSIIARGQAAGYILRMPTEEKKIKTKKEFLTEIATLLGGYWAEKLKFNELTTGAANDIKIASEIAQRLVREYGMSSLGPIDLSQRREMISSEREIGSEKNYSEKLATKIEAEIEKIIKEAEEQAKSILKKRKKLLEKIAKVLIDKETIEKEEFEELIRTRKKPTGKKIKT